MFEADGGEVYGAFFCFLVEDFELDIFFDLSPEDVFEESFVIDFNLVDMGDGFSFFEAR